MGGQRLGGKVTGVSSAAVDNLEEQKAKLQKEALDALIEHYSAPDGPAGDKQRKAADERLQEAWRQEQRRADQIAGIQEIRATAIASKDDLRQWFELLYRQTASAGPFA